MERWKTEDGDMGRWGREDGENETLRVKRVMGKNLKVAGI
jgi:hypothetical protein